MPVIRFDESMSRTIFWVIAGSVLILGSLMVAPFVPAIMWAAVLSVLTYPAYTWLRSKRVGEVSAALIVTLGTLMVIVLPIVGFGTAAALEIQKAIPSGGIQPENGKEFTIATVAGQVDKTLEPWLSQININAVREFRLSDWITKNESTIREAVVGPATQGIRKFLTAIGSALIAILTMFFMIKDGHRLTEPTLAIVPLPRDEALKILVRLRETVFSVFVGVVFVALLQGAFAGIAFWYLKIPGAIIWTLATAMFACIPLVGPPVVVVPIILVLFAQGRVPEAIGLAIYLAAFITQIDNVLRPLFIGAKASLHPLAVFFSLVGGVLFFGPIGLMAGPLLLTLCIIVAEVVISRRRLMDEESQRQAETPEGLEDGGMPSPEPAQG